MSTVNIFTDWEKEVVDEFLIELQKQLTNKNTQW